MIKALFVDDDENIIEGYKRMFFSIRKSWEIDFALSGETALELFAHKRYDVVVSDMRMPKMDGAELLAIIKDRYPSTIRIILSGYQDEEKVVKTTTAAHQYLHKPTGAGQLKDLIEHIYELRFRLERENVATLINGIGHLPSLPELYIRLEEEINNPDSSFENIKNIISEDPAITAKLLQTVNSGFFGLPRKISDLLEALSYLGTNTIKSIILYLQVFNYDKFTPQIRSFCEHLGNHSLRTAQIAKVLARFEKQNKSLIEDAFIAGILHDVGKLIFIQMDGFFEKMHSMSKNSKLTVAEMELEITGVRHEAAGAYLLGVWGLPSNIVDAVYFHHLPVASQSSQFDEITAVHCANALEMDKSSVFTLESLNLDLIYLENFELLKKVETWWNLSKNVSGGNRE